MLKKANGEDVINVDGIKMNLVKVGMTVMIMIQIYIPEQGEIMIVLVMLNVMRVVLI